MREEIDYGINAQGLPVIVVYPEYASESDLLTADNQALKQAVKNLWDKLPIFRDSMSSVPTLHVPNKKSVIEKALNNAKFMVGTKGASVVFYKP